MLSVIILRLCPLHGGLVEDTTSQDGTELQDGVGFLFSLAKEILFRWSGIGNSVRQ